MEINHLGCYIVTRNQSKISDLKKQNQVSFICIQLNGGIKELLEEISSSFQKISNLHGYLSDKTC